MITGCVGKSSISGYINEHPLDDASLVICLLSHCPFDLVLITSLVLLTTSNMASIQALRTRSQAKRQQPPQQDTTPFFIPDSSPLFQYGDGIKSTWTPGYALQADGFDQTLHLTSSRERISFNISGKHFRRKDEGKDWKS